jgi:hypothetical protein
VAVTLPVLELVAVRVIVALNVPEKEVLPVTDVAPLPPPMLRNEVDPEIRTGD